MDIKSFGALPPGPALEDERKKTADKIRAESAFVRATPPEAEANPEFDKNEVQDGLLRMADYLSKFKSKKKSKKQTRPKTTKQRAVASYSKVAQAENSESSKGFQLSKLV